MHSAYDIESSATDGLIVLIMLPCVYSDLGFQQAGVKSLYFLALGGKLKIPP